MKSEKDPLKVLFEGLKEDQEPINLERQGNALKRFKRERIHLPIEGDKGRGFHLADPDQDSRLDEKPLVEKRKPHGPKDPPGRS